MIGWIVYNKDDAKINNNYIGWYIDGFKSYGVDLRLVYTDEMDYNSLPDFAIVRAIRPDITQKLEKMDVRCFNNGFVSEICNDKAKTYKYVSSRGVDILPTYYSINEVKNYPVVIKPKDSHGGDRVNMANSHSDLMNIMPLYNGDNYVVQDVASDVGKDVRVYVIGNKIITAMLRVSHKDFRSNFCLGGSASVYNLTTDEIKQVNKIIELFDFDFVGIDFVFNNGKMVFNEIEDVVGSRMVYSYTDIDIVSMYIKYIMEKMNFDDIKN